MKIRRSLFIPLVSISFLFLAYLQLVWIPQVSESIKKIYENELQAHMRSVSEGITPLLLEYQLANVYESLDAVLQHNTTWKSITLTDNHGRVIYPLSQKKITLTDNPNIQTLTQPVGVIPPYQATLKVDIDTTAILKKTNELVKTLEIVLVFLVILFVFVIGVIFETIVSKRLNHLLDALRGSETIKNSILDTAGEAIISIDEKGIISQFNKAAEKLTGYSSSEIINQQISLLIPSEYLEQHISGIQKYQQTRESHMINNHKEVMITTKSGDEVPVSISISDTGITGKFRFTGILHDLRSTRAAEKRIRDSEDILRRYTNALATFNCMLTLDGKIKLVNNSAVAVTGLSAEDFIGQYLWDTHWCNYTEKLQIQVQKDVIECAKGKILDGEMRMQTLQSDFIIIHFILTPIKNDEGTVIYLIAEGQDITEQKASARALKQKTVELEQAKLKYKQLSETDPLTQIPNRRFYEERLSHEIMAARRSNRPLAMMMIDIDYFKQYNDTFGHDAGDITLKNIAHVILSELPRSTDLAARFGGEEFVVLLPSTAVEGAFLVAERIRSHVLGLSIKNPVDDKHNNILSVSIGITALSGNLLNKEDLLHQSDNALYTAKDKGRNCCYIFSSEKTKV